MKIIVNRSHTHGTSYVCKIAGIHYCTAHPLSSLLSSSFYYAAISITDNDCDDIINSYSAKSYGDKVLFSGSVSEHLALKYPPSDLDIMHHIRLYAVVDHFMYLPILNPEDYVNRNIIMRLRESNTHPGYVLLYDIYKGCYLSSLKYSMNMKENFFRLSNSDGKKFRDDEILTHGPALSKLSNSSLDVDLVMALPYLAWPSEALSWIYRPRKSGWPNQAMVLEIVSHGCHCVANGYPLSLQSHLEFRMSFSLAEVKLGRSLTPGQRISYLTFKALCKGVLGSNILRSYHLKTIMFWLCEKIPASKWTGKFQVERLLDLFDAVINCISENNLPNYFIAKNNMISHLDRTTKRHVLKELIAIRQDFSAAIRTFFYINRQDSSLSLLANMTDILVDGQQMPSDTFKFYDFYVACAANFLLHPSKKSIHDAANFFKWAYCTAAELNFPKNKINKESLENMIGHLRFRMYSEGVRNEDLYQI